MKNLILVAVLLLIVSSLSFGQSATITATVQTALSISTQANLIIGIVEQNASKSIASTDGAAAAFTITGQPSSTTIVTVATPANLTFGLNDLQFDAVTPVWNTTQSQTGTTAFAGSTGGNADLNATGNLYVYVGGGVTATVGQASGSYSGTINVSVVYP
jgi:hypothetical protein